MVAGVSTRRERRADLLRMGAAYEARWACHAWWAAGNASSTLASQAAELQPSAATRHHGF